MAIIQKEDRREFAQQVAYALGYPTVDILLGSPSDACPVLEQSPKSPPYIFVDIGDKVYEILPEIDKMAEYCNPGTRVVVVGETNDVNLYRELRQRGVLEYFTLPVKISDVRQAFMYDDGTAPEDSHAIVLSFLSAASGDGGSTIALNTAYALAENYKKPTIIIDMDFQFGLIARNLDLSTPFGIKELLEHPERSVDHTLLQRMIVKYNEHLHVIAAPTDLRLWPNVKAELIRDLLIILRQNYDYIILDLPHIWSSWVAAALNDSTETVLIGQLWLGSATHAARILNMMREVGVEDKQISIGVNRSGAKFKETITVGDYERVCKHTVNHYFPNDIKSAVMSESQGKTLMEIGNSVLARECTAFAKQVHDRHTPAETESSSQARFRRGH